MEYDTEEYVCIPLLSYYIILIFKLLGIIYSGHFPEPTLSQHFSQLTQKLLLTCCRTPTPPHSSFLQSRLGLAQASGSPRVRLSLNADLDRPSVMKV